MSEPTLEQIAAQMSESPFYCATNQAVLAREILALRASITQGHLDEVQWMGEHEKRLDALEGKPGSRNLQTVQAPTIGASPVASAINDIRKRLDALEQARPILRRRTIEEIVDILVAKVAACETNIEILKREAPSDAMRLRVETAERERDAAQETLTKVCDERAQVCADPERLRRFGRYSLFRS